MKLLKILIIAVFGTVSMLTAARFTESYVAETSAREKTLAEAVMQNQLAAEIKKAEEEAAKQFEERGETVVTTVMETKPPVTTTEETTVTTEETTVTTVTTVTETAVTTTVPETTVTETETSAEEEIITEFTRGGLLPEDRTGVPVKSMFTLTAEEQEIVTNFLIEHYFLDGYRYSKEETRPELKEKKRLAAEMEGRVIETLNIVMANVNSGDITAILTADYGEMTEEVKAVREDFAEKYRDVYLQGEIFGELYGDSLKYFDRIVQAFEKLAETAEQYKNASNPLFALSLAAKSLDSVIMPEIMGVLEQSFDLIEVTQEIFLEGTQGTVLLTRDEVRDIVLNPGLVFAAIN
ncbi:MAG: hypothetical protein NC253_11455 [Ruminococcus sp.]|nr:hypothetical protein [Ruminococcus sp.]